MDLRHIVFCPSAVETRNAVARGELRVDEVVKAALERIARLEPAVHAWETLDPAHALAQAHRLEAQLVAASVPGVLAGVPIGVKDIVDTADLPTGYGSRIYRGSLPAADAACVTLARSAGAIVMGKTVTTELAYFTPGPTANPWNVAHTPGGSSSGSAAAVASGMVPLALGTQTAGSVIRPASYCGVFALKPSFGAIGMAGAKAFAPSLDTLGWFARTADDLELMRCALVEIPYEPLEVPHAADVRLGVCEKHEAPLLDAGGREVWEQAQSLLSGSRLTLQAIAMPEALSGLLEAQKTIMACEAVRSLEGEWREHRGALSEALVALLELGRGIDEADHRRAQDLAAAARPMVAALMEGLDALLVPSAPGEAPAGLGATGDPAFNRVWTLLGLPCVNVPGLSGPTGLPVGLQLVGHAGEERRLLCAAACLHGILSSSASLVTHE
jgi:Asp-tRNA(Asn)/Glu-tRNA(Gln) amidotransferase A subunit family amidase